MFLQEECSQIIGTWERNFLSRAENFSYVFKKKQKRIFSFFFLNAVTNLEIGSMRRITKMTSENHLFLSETNQLKGKIIQQRFEENYKHKKKSTSQIKFTQVNSMFEER